MNWLQLAGKIDGYIMALAATYGVIDPQHQGYALLVGGIAGGVGAILNSVSVFLGQPAVVTPVPPTNGASK